MVSEKGGLASARQLIDSKQPLDGYTQLYLKGRLDLTVEALVVEEIRWHELFTAEQLRKAEARLLEYHYQPKAR